MRARFVNIFTGGRKTIFSETISQKTISAVFLAEILNKQEVKIVSN